MRTQHPIYGPKWIAQQRKIYLKPPVQPYGFKPVGGQPTRSPTNPDWIFNMKRLDRVINLSPPAQPHTPAPTKANLTPTDQPTNPAITERIDVRMRKWYPVAYKPYKGWPRVILDSVGVNV